MSSSTVEIIGGRERRRRWSLEDKLRIVAETHEPGASVRAVAARHDVYPGLLHTWRRQARERRLGAAVPARFVPVQFAAPPPCAVAEALPRDAAGTETIEIALPDGSRLRVGNAVTLAALRRVLTALRG